MSSSVKTGQQPHHTAGTQHRKLAPAKSSSPSTDEELMQVGKRLCFDCC